MNTFYFIIDSSIKHNLIYFCFKYSAYFRVYFSMCICKSGKQLVCYDLLLHISLIIELYYNYY